MAVRHGLVASIGMAVALLIGSTQSADALQIRLTSGASSVTVADGDASDLAAAVGAVTFSGAVGIFGVNITTGLSDPVLQPPYPNMDLNSVNVSSGGAGTLTMWLTDESFNSRDLLSLIGGTVSNRQGSTLVATLFAGSSAFDEGQQIWQGSFGAGAFSAQGLADSILSTPYFLTMRVDITHVALDSSSFNWKVEVPEPTSLALLGLGLVAAGFASRRKVAA